MLLRMAQLTPRQFTTSQGSLVTLRSPRVGEGEALLRVVREIMRQAEHLLIQEDEFTYTTEQENEMIRAYGEHPDKIMIVPEVGGRIVGMMSFAVGGKRRIAHTGEFGISLLPEFQGRGIGRRMTESLISWARANPRVEALRLRVHASNTPGVELYKRMGFSEEGREIRGAKLGPERYDDVILMALDVRK